MSDNWEVSDEEFVTAETNSTSENEAAEIAELADGFSGYEAFDFEWYVQQVADRIYNIHSQRDIEAMFIFSLDCNAEGEINGGEVALSIPNEWSLYLMESLELKHLTDDRSATGMAGLLAIKSVLLTSYGNLHRYATRKGLLPAD